MYALKVMDRLPENDNLPGRLLDNIIAPTMAECLAKARELYFGKIYMPGELPLKLVAEMWAGGCFLSGRFETVNTLELRQGDLVITHHLIVHLGRRQVSAMHNDVSEDSGWCEYGPDDLAVYDMRLGQAASTPWNIQGNRLATWVRVKKA